MLVFAVLPVREPCATRLLFAATVGAAADWWPGLTAVQTRLHRRPSRAASVVAAHRVALPRRSRVGEYVKRYFIGATVGYGAETGVSNGIRAIATKG